MSHRTTWLCVATVCAVFVCIAPHALAKATPDADAATTPAIEAANEAAAAADEPPTLAHRLWVFAGVFHPMVVHFPIALLLLAAMIEAARFFGLTRVSYDVTWTCLVVGAATAVLAALLGWANATYLNETTTLTRHRTLGISVTVLAIAVAAFATWQRHRGQFFPSRGRLAAVTILAAATGLTGHLGGQLVYGDDYIQRAWRFVAQPADNGPAASLHADAIPWPDLDDPDTQVDFNDHVWPILQARCIECHGPDKAEGNLRLDSEDHALKGGEVAPAYEPGDPEFSHMIELLLENEPRFRMPPPDSGIRVPEQEIEILKRWIAQGARWQ